MKKHLTNGSIYLIASVLNSAVPFLLLPFLTRVLTPSDYGVIAMFAVVLQFISALTGASTTGAISVRFFQLKETEFATYIFSCLIILVSTIVLLCLFVLAFNHYLSPITFLDTSWLIFVVFVASAQFIINIRLALWRVQQKAKQFGTFQVLNTLLNGGLSITFLLLIAETWEFRVLGQAVATFCFSMISLYSLIKAKAIITSFDCTKIKDALSFGVPLIPHAIGSVIIVMADRFIVANILGSEEAGVYMVALQLGLALGLVADAFSKVYGPALYEMLNQGTEKIKLKVVAITYIIFITFLLLVLPAYFIISYFFPLIVGEQYSQSQPLIFWFLLGNAFTGMYYAVAGFYFFSSKTSYISIITVLSGGGSVCLTYFMVQEFALLGGAISFAIGQFLMFIMACGFSYKVCRLPWFQFRRAYKVLMGGKYEKHCENTR